MDVDVCSDEIIVYLHRDDLKKLKTDGQIFRNICKDPKEKSKCISVHFNEKRKIDTEHYDDVMDALSVTHGMLYYLFELNGDIETAKQEWNYKKIMNTFEYYDEIRSHYK